MSVRKVKKNIQAEGTERAKAQGCEPAWEVVHR